MASDLVSRDGMYHRVYHTSISLASMEAVSSSNVYRAGIVGRLPSLTRFEEVRLPTNAQADRTFLASFAR